MIKVFISLLFSVSLLCGEDLGVMQILSQSSAQTTSESIDFLNASEQKMHQLTIQESSPHIYNPIKEGLQGDKILLDVNGVRMSNALFRSGPNQYFSWVPRAFVRSIDEDAPAQMMLNNSLGGEINQNLGVEASALGVSVDSANSGVSGVVSYKDEESQVGSSWVETGNVYDTKGEVAHSNYNQKSLFAQSESLENNKMVFLLSQSNDIPRTDHYTQDRPYDYELQRYIHLSDKLDFLPQHSVQLSYQNFNERINDEESISKTENSIYGVQYTYEISDTFGVSVSDYVEDITYNESKFLYNTFDLQGAYDINLELFDILMAYTFSYADISKDTAAQFSNHGGFIKLKREAWELSLVQGHRFPSIINLAKSIITEKGMDLANPDLKAETSTSLRLEYSTKRYFFKAYYRHLNNLITREFIGENSDGIELYETINAKTGEMYGAIAGSNIDFDELKTSLYLEYTYGKTESDYISKITPFHATLMMQYRGFFAQELFALKAVNMSESDQHDIRIIDHNNGYNITNLGYQWMSRHHKIKLMLNNIFNQEGRVYASSVDFAKRSAELGYTYYF